MALTAVRRELDERRTLEAPGSASCRALNLQEDLAIRRAFEAIPIPDFIAVQFD